MTDPLDRSVFEAAWTIGLVCSGTTEHATEHATERMLLLPARSTRDTVNEAAAPWKAACVDSIEDITWDLVCMKP